ncbi:hypothetical protein [Dyella lutea]|uniref:Uncharacterized protein n=1 Tax=Dyella lutea TaxID=2950441 RepID=A0ABT1F8B8_9GAMM|nr:hypothetical protein [Dyella lutea]MCP1373596.1 hypothetical protein [Dyella lutea]
MPPPSPDRDVPRAIVLLQSPREAAEQARVYRRRTRQKPRDRWLRIVALVGSLCVHFGFLLGVILGPVYVPDIPPEQPGDALQVRLIEKKKDEPPPPPPPLGALPKKVGPVHRGTARRGAVRVARTASPALPAVPAPSPLPVPSIEPPVIDAVKHTVVPRPDKAVAAKAPPVAVPRPAPTPDLQPVPLAGEPPTVTLDTPPMAKPVPPKFQPEPPRKPQLEGNRPIPPPASLAMPELPPQSPPKLAPPMLALDTRVPVSPAPASLVVARPEVTAAPPVPDLAPVPLPAQAAPTVNLAPQLTPPSPVVTVQRPSIRAPAVAVAPAEQPELAAVPVAPRAPTLSDQPTPLAFTAPQVAPPAAKVAVTVARPELSPEPAEATPKPASVPAAPAVAAKAAVASAPAAEASSPASAAHAGQTDVSSAPDATPQGSDTATPGSPQGVKQPSSLLIGKDGSIMLPTPGRGAGKAPGAVAQGTSAQGADQGIEGNPALGQYIQLRPHGDTQIMRHRAPDIGYRPTRFDQDWAPEGESSIDSALRHAVEKTTVKHTFHLPRGVRIQCVAMPLLPVALLGCRNPDPPAKPLEQAIYNRLNLPATPLAPPPPAPATAPAPVTPIRLDNTVQCASARVAGAPLPPGCEDPLAAPRAVPSPAPASSSNWVPASDQFQPVH